MANPGPAIQTTVNTQSPRSAEQFIQTIGVSMTPTAVGVSTAVEQSFGANGATQATAATGILAGDVILSVSAPSALSHVGIAGWRVDLATNDKFYICFQGDGTGATPPSGVYTITVARFNQSTTVTPGTLSSLPTVLTSN